MRFVNISPVKEKTLCIIENEMIVAEFLWVDDDNKIAELNVHLANAGYSPLSSDEIDEIERHILMIDEDKKSIE
jgi:hypothetical protein